MKNINIIFSTLLVVSMFFSCSSAFDVDEDNILDESIIIEKPEYVEGLLLKAYSQIPGYSSSYYATDDAVSNSASNNFDKMAMGAWSRSFSPISQWAECYKNILYINKFLSLADVIKFNDNNTYKDSLIRVKTKAEAYALRAYYEFLALQSSGGKVNGELKGIVLFNNPIEYNNESLNKARSPYQECVDSIISDLDKAIDVLPFEWEDVSGSMENVDEYNSIMGRVNETRINGKVAMALKSRILCYTASPAFDPSDEKYVRAAYQSAELIEKLGGLDNLSSDGGEFYKNYNDTKEIIWRSTISNNNTIEKNNYPRYIGGELVGGNGTVNPSQNLVDAFPLITGDPIVSESGDTSALYKSNTPYRYRDPRLAKYIIYNGNTIQNKNVEISDNSDNGTGVVSGISTRTGYYLKKLSIESVANTVSKGVITGKADHFTAYIRYTEILLNYAEDANEAYGPDGSSDNTSITPREIVKAIRKRGGILVDNYVSDISSKDDMRQLIRNERRIELCFEGFRFWDLRRWNLSGSELSETLRGVYIKPNASGGFDYTYENIENRNYEDYMIYGPIIKTDVAYSGNLEQNDGWDK